MHCVEGEEINEKTEEVDLNGFVNRWHGEVGCRDVLDCKI